MKTTYRHARADHTRSANTSFLQPSVSFGLNLRPEAQHCHNINLKIEHEAVSTYSIWKLQKPCPYLLASFSIYLVIGLTDICMAVDSPPKLLNGPSQEVPDVITQMSVLREVSEEMLKQPLKRGTKVSWDRLLQIPWPYSSFLHIIYARTLLSILLC